MSKTVPHFPQIRFCHQTTRVDVIADPRRQRNKNPHQKVRQCGQESVLNNNLHKQIKIYTGLVVINSRLNNFGIE